MPNAVVEKKAKTITIRMLISIAISISNFGLVYGLNILLANRLGAEDYGDYVVAISTANFLALVALLGLEKLATRFLPSFLQLQQHGKGHGLLRYTFWMVTGAGLLFAVIGVLVMGLLVADGHTHPLFIAFWLVPLIAVTRIFSIWIRTTDHYLAAQTPNFLQEPLITIALIYLIFLLDEHLTDFLVIKLVFISLLSVLLIELLYLKKFLPHKLFQHRPEYEAKKWLTVSIPMMLSTLVFLAMQQVDLWLIELLGNNEYMVGYYSAISRTMAFYILVLTAVTTYVAPEISAFVESKKMAELQKIITNAQKILISFSLVLTAIIIILGKQILGLFGENFETNYVPLLISMIGNSINLMLGVSFILLQNANFEKLTLISAAIALLIHIILDVILIPIYGLYGVVFAETLTISGLYFWYAWVSWRRLQIKLLPF